MSTSRLFLVVMAGLLSLVLTPPMVAQEEWTSLPGSSDMVVRGDYAFIRGLRQAQNGEDVLYVVDLRSMSLVSTTPASGGLSQIMSLGGRHVVTREGSDIVVYDVSNPESPSIVSARPYAGGPVALSGHFLYRPLKYGFRVYDYSNPSNPMLAGEYTSADEIPGDPLVLSEQYVAVNHHIFDVSDPTQPSLLGSTLPIGLFRHHNPPTKLGDYLYRSVMEDRTGTAYLRTVDISSIDNPVELARLSLPRETDGWVVTDGHYLYLVYSFRGQDAFWLQVYIAGNGVPAKLGPPIELDPALTGWAGTYKAFYVTHEDLGLRLLHVPRSAFGYTYHLPLVQR